MRPCNTAFTLVELLVVIGIIALLIAILLPALNRARMAAQAVTCASNQKQLLLGLQMYAEEHDGWYPPTYPLYKELTVDGFTARDVRIAWYGQPLIGQYIGNRNPCGSAFPQAQQRPSTDVVYCPTVRPQSRGFLDTGIGYNNSRQNEINRTDPSNPSIGRVRKLGTFRSPYKVIMLVDTMSDANISFQWDRYYRGQTGGTTGEENPQRGYVAYRHNGAANVGFADGHVEAIKSDYPDNPSYVNTGLYKALQANQVTHRAGAPN